MSKGMGTDFPIVSTEKHFFRNLFRVFVLKIELGREAKRATILANSVARIQVFLTLFRLLLRPQTN